MQKNPSLKGPFFLNFPGEKHTTHQAILLSALGNGVSELTNIDISPETNAWITALHEVGIVTQLDQQFRSCILAGANQKLPKKQTNLSCKNSDTILYLFMTLCAASSGIYYIDGDTNLRQRSLSPIMQLLHQQGVRFIPDDNNHLPFTFIGTQILTGGELVIDETIPAPFVANLLMLAPFAKSAFHFKIADSLNTDYLDKTCTMMAEFGVLVHRSNKNEFFVPVPQHYQARDYEIETDFSLAPYFFALAMITNNQLIIPTDHATRLTENKSLPLLKKMGCHFETNGIEFSLRRSTTLEGIEINLANFSDYFIMLAIIAPFASTESRISCPSLSNQEEESVIALKDALLKLNVQAAFDHHCLHIAPSTPKGCLIETHGNAHLAIAMMILSAKIPGLLIDDDECILKKYPAFSMLWEQLTSERYAIA